MEPGYYEDCTIVEAKMAEKAETLVMAFTCSLPQGGNVEVEQRMSGDKPVIREIARDVCEVLGMEFSPAGLSTIGELVGRKVTLKMKIGHDQKGNSYENWNIATKPKAKALDTAAAASRLKAYFEDDIPF